MEPKRGKEKNEELFTRLRSLSSTCLAGQLMPQRLQVHDEQLSLTSEPTLALALGNKSPVEQALQGRPDVIVPNSVGSVHRGHCAVKIFNIHIHSDPFVTIHLTVEMPLF